MDNGVIYARFSSQGQNEQSIEAQVRICKEFAEGKDINIVNIYIYRHVYFRRQRVQQYVSADYRQRNI